MKTKLFLLSLSLAIISSCTPQIAEIIKIAGYTQGTTYHITYTGEDSISYKTEIDSILHAFDLSLSTYIPNSLISTINSTTEPVETDEFMAYIAERSIAITKETQGAFDITVGPIFSAYGFGKDKKHILAPRVIDSIMQYVGINNFELGENTIRRKTEGAMMNVNAIAQGYSVDVVSDFLESKGVENYLVEIGGEVLGKGNKNGKPWRVGIDKPIENNFNPGANLQAIVELNDKALATSGNYRNYFEIDGQKVVHILDPRTGISSPQNLLSATIIADDCTTADAYATACMVMGLEASVKLLESKPGIDAYLIYTDEKGDFAVYRSSGLQDIIIEQ